MCDHISFQGHEIRKLEKKLNVTFHSEKFPNLRAIRWTTILYVKYMMLARYLDEKPETISGQFDYNIFAKSDFPLYFRRPNKSISPF